MQENKEWKEEEGKGLIIPLYAFPLQKEPNTNDDSNMNHGEGKKIIAPWRI